MSDENVTIRMLREIQRELADMRDDHTVMVAILNRLDASVSGLQTGQSSLGVEMLALHSRFNKVRSDSVDFAEHIIAFIRKMAGG